MAGNVGPVYIDLANWTPIPLFKDSPINWKAGDMAVCVETRPWKTLNGNPAAGPECGEVRRVVAVQIEYGVQWLKIVGYTGEYSASSFTKVPPREEESESKEER